MRGLHEVDIRMKCFVTRALARFFVLATAAIAVSCGGNDGSSANPPTDVVVTAGENSATLTWTMEPGVEYWIFRAAATSINETNWPSLPEAGVVRPAVSPQIVVNLVNGTTYSFTINGRRDGGPGGTGSPSVSAVPRIAGAAWIVGPSLGADDLRGIAFASKFVAVGTNGTIRSSVTGSGTWTTETSGTTAALNVSYVGVGGFLAAGAGGTLLISADAVTWTAQTSNTTQELFGAIAKGDGSFIVVGANGTILTGSTTTTWTVQTSGTTQNLNAIALGAGRFVAVGAGGTIVTSTTDTAVWTAATSNTTANLRALAFGNGLFVAVGDGGALVTSPDGTTWTAQTAIAPNNFTGVTAGLQFVAVGSGGAIYTSTDGVAWTAQNSGTTQDLNAVARGGRGYGAVGAGGTNLTAF